jgi:hypothetical protein
MCLICLLIVKQTSTSQYTSKIGQNTGMSRTGKNVAIRPNRNALEDKSLHFLYSVKDCDVLNVFKFVY